MAITVQIHDHSARISMSGRFDFQVHREFKEAYTSLIEDVTVH